MIFLADVRDGLGNQMFKYAAFRKLQLLTNMDGICTAQSRTRTCGHSFFQLDRFNITDRLQIATSHAEYAKTAPAYIKRCDKLHNDLFFKKASFNPADLQKKGIFIAYCTPPETDLPLNLPRYYMNGVFFIPAYFDSIKETLMKEFTLRRPLSPKNKKTLHLIQRTPNSVCLHIRRGDYAKTPMNNVCTPAYYMKSIKIILSKYPDATFFVFSNDMLYAKQLKKLPVKLVFVENNSEADATEELELMKACKHFIIANSTFSFWSQYLSANADKIVISTKDYFSAKSVAMYSNHNFLAMPGQILVDSSGKTTLPDTTRKIPALCKPLLTML